MMHRLYCLKDILVGFSTPFDMSNDDVAVRAFAGSAQSPEPNAVNINPEHKQLWFVGTFDDQTAAFTSEPVFLADAAPFCKRKEVEPNDLAQ